VGKQARERIALVLWVFAVIGLYGFAIWAARQAALPPCVAVKVGAIAPETPCR
jgi:hypothetical protein